jgi:NAD+ kinase
MRVGIVAQKSNDRAATLARDTRDALQAAGVEVHVDETTAATLELPGVPVSDLETCDLVVSIGGDGTFLYAARGAAGTPVLGVNLGEVGFLNAVGPDEAIDAVMREVEAFRGGGPDGGGDGDGTGEHRALDVREVPRLAARGEGWASDPAMNEVVVQGPRRGHGGGADLTVRVDGSTFAEGHADGVLVATSTGSTAYNLSERGPLVHPGVGGLIVTGMSATDGMPPLVVPADAEVTVDVDGAEQAVVVSDGRSVERVRPPATVTVATTDPPVRLAGPRPDFFEALGKLD